MFLGFVSFFCLLDSRTNGANGIGLGKWVTRGIHKNDVMTETKLMVLVISKKIPFMEAKYLGELFWFFGCCFFLSFEVSPSHRDLVGYGVYS